MDRTMGVTAGSQVAWIDRPHLGLGSVLKVVPRKAWGGGYIEVRFPNHPELQQPYRLNHDEVIPIEEPARELVMKFRLSKASIRYLNFRPDLLTLQEIRQAEMEAAIRWACAGRPA